jgi:hypothetical protein
VGAKPEPYFWKKLKGSKNEDKFANNIKKLSNKLKWDYALWSNM